MIASGSGFIPTAWLRLNTHTTTRTPFIRTTHAFPDTATALRNMALAWKRLGDLERMAEAWQRADAVDKASKTAARR